MPPHNCHLVTQNWDNMSGTSPGVTTETVQRSTSMHKDGFLNNVNVECLHLFCLWSDKDENKGEDKMEQNLKGNENTHQGTLESFLLYIIFYIVFILM